MARTTFSISVTAVTSSTRTTIILAVILNTQQTRVKLYYCLHLRYIDLQFVPFADFFVKFFKLVYADEPLIYI